jgi:RNA polymerase sigma-70 factor (ECF subfamily)
LSDAALAASLQAGEPGAPEALFARYGRYVERLIVATVGSDPEVPDLVHDVFVQALEGIAGLREPRALRAWIGSMAIFTARGFLRHRIARRHGLQFLSMDVLPDPIAPGTLCELRLVLEHASAVLNGIPENERRAYALRVLQGARLAEVARTVGVSLATIKRRLARAERRFRAAAMRDPILREYVLGDPGETPGRGAGEAREWD